MTDPKPVLIWDLPVRLFHWSMAVTFVAAFAIATLSSEHSLAFTVHMLLGLVLVFIVFLRIAWGVVGSRYARFTSFAFSPAALLRYLRDARAGRDQPRPGHNPGSSYAIYAMLAIPLALGATGLWGGELTEDLHAILAYALAGVAVLHLLGLVWHTIRHRERIALSMFSGLRRGVGTEGLSSARPLAAILFLVLIGAWSATLVSGYDAAKQQIVLPIVGTTLKLGEPEEREHGGTAERGDDDDDDD